MRPDGIAMPDYDCCYKCLTGRHEHAGRSTACDCPVCGHEPVSIDRGTYIEVRCARCDVLWPCEPASAAASESAP